MKKRIGIFLYQNNKSQVFANNALLMAAAEELGYQVDSVHVTELTWKIMNNKVKVYWKGKPLPKYDFIIGRYRISGEMPVVAPLAKVVQDSGVRVFNNVDAALLAKSKSASQVALAQAGVPTPKAAIVFGSDQLDFAVRGIKGPFITKAIFGSLGIGVFLAESVKALRSIVDFVYHRQFRDPVVIQEMVKQDAPSDIRALVIGNKVIASMQRTASKKEFRSNLSRSGIGTPIKLSKAQENIAVKAAKTIGLDYAGVDLIVGKNKKTYVLEVNANPGLTGIVNVTGINVPKLLIKHCAKLAKK